jgi:hypothetical protein
LSETSIITLNNMLLADRNFVQEHDTLILSSPH